MDGSRTWRPRTWLDKRSTSIVAPLCQFSTRGDDPRRPVSQYSSGKLVRGRPTSDSRSLARVVSKVDSAYLAVWRTASTITHVPPPLAVCRDPSGGPSICHVFVPNRNNLEVSTDPSKMALAYPRLDVRHLASLLEKYRDLSIAAKIRSTVGDEVPQIEPARVTAILKRLKQQGL